MKQFSPIFKLNLQDFIKGFVVAVGGALFTVLETCVRTWTWTFDWQDVLKVAVSAGVAYLGKQFFTDQPKTVVVDTTKTTVVDTDKNIISAV